MNSIDSLKNYKDLKLVLAIKGINPTERDKELCHIDPKVYLWDEQFIEYYHALQKKIGKYAKYEIQREIEVKLDDSEYSKLKNMPSLKIRLDQNEFYFLTAADPIELLKVAYVARRERGDQNFYQRMINEQKIKKIAYQIQKNKLSFFNNVILSTLNEDGLNFNEINSNGNVSLGTLSVDSNFKSLWIVDGQHRLYGYTKVKDVNDLNTPKIPVSIIVSKSERNQGDIFISINTNQTILSEDYKWDLYGVYTLDAKRNISALTPKKLNELSNLKDRIYIPSMSPTRKKGSIGISKVARTINEQPKLFYGNLDDNRQNPIIKQKDSDQKNVERLANFIDSSLNHIGKHHSWLLKFFITTTGIQIFIILLSNHLLYYGGSEDIVKEYLTLLCANPKSSTKFDTDAKIKSIEKSLNSREEKRMLISEMITWINEKNGRQRADVKPLPEIAQRETSQEVEKTIREFVKEQLLAEDQEWFVKLLPADVTESLRIKHKNKSNEELWNYVDIGSMIKIIDTGRNWDRIFNPIFLDNESSTFSDKGDVIYTFKNFKKMRDAESHGRMMEQVDKQMGDAAALKITTFIKGFTESPEED